MVSLTRVFTFFQHNIFIYCLKITYMFMKYVDHKYPLFSPTFATRKPYDIPLSTSCPFGFFFSSPFCPVVTAHICMGYTLWYMQPTNGQLQKQSYSPNSSFFTVLLDFPSISLQGRKIFCLHFLLFIRFQGPFVPSYILAM